MKHSHLRAMLITLLLSTSFLFTFAGQVLAKEGIVQRFKNYSKKVLREMPKTYTLLGIDRVYPEQDSYTLSAKLQRSIPLSQDFDLPFHEIEFYLNKKHVGTAETDYDGVASIDLGANLFPLSSDNTFFFELKCATCHKNTKFINRSGAIYIHQKGSPAVIIGGLEGVVWTSDFDNNNGITLPWGEHIEDRELLGNPIDYLAKLEKEGIQYFYVTHRDFNSSIASKDFLKAKGLKPKVILHSNFLKFVEFDPSISFLEIEKLTPHKDSIFKNVLVTNWKKHGAWPWNASHTFKRRVMGELYDIMGEDILLTIVNEDQEMTILKDLYIPAIKVNYTDKHKKTKDSRGKTVYYQDGISDWKQIYDTAIHNRDDHTRIQKARAGGPGQY